MSLKTIFIVDDMAVNRELVVGILEDDYRVIAISSIPEMMTKLKRVRPDLILLDINLEKISGKEGLRQLKDSDSYCNIPVIMLTGANDPEIEAECFYLGAVDFISTPFYDEILKHRIRLHLNIEDAIYHREKKFIRLRDSLISVLVEMIESRDYTTGFHVENTTSIFRELITTMSTKSEYSSRLHRVDLDTIISATRLHDIGKITVSDVILNKPGKLTPEEYDAVKIHTTRGGHIIDQIIKRSESIDFLEEAKILALHHHERWDGSGYPFKLVEEAIPFPARILSIADVYDALRAKRPYKEPMDHSTAVEIIVADSGKAFDPRIIKVFTEIADRLPSCIQHR